MCLCGDVLDENDVVWTLSTDKTTGRYVLSIMCSLFSSDVSSQVVFCCCSAKLYLISFRLSLFLFTFTVCGCHPIKKDYKVYLKHVWWCLWHVLVNGKKKLFFFSSGWCCVILFSFVLYILVSAFIFSFIKFGGPSVHFFSFVCFSRIVLWLQIFHSVLRA